MYFESVYMIRIFMSALDATFFQKWNPVNTFCITSDMTTPIKIHFLFRFRKKTVNCKKIIRCTAHIITSIFMNEKCSFAMILILILSEIHCDSGHSLEAHLYGYEIRMSNAISTWPTLYTLYQRSTLHSALKRFYHQPSPCSHVHYSSKAPCFSVVIMVIICQNVG